MKTYFVLPNFRMNKTEAPDAWTGREVTVLRTSGADALVEVVLSEDRMVAGQEVWLPKTRLDGYKEPIVFTLVQPRGCDGSGKYAYDPKAEDGRGAKLSPKCPGCRACS